ncbi:MAG TPA: OmpA family protein [Bacteroidales bacterium]|nr:OmpA family protein [Bacteroidales bacterium]
MKIKPVLLIALLSALYLTSCVPSSKFNALKEESKQKIDNLKQENLALLNKSNEQEFLIEKLREQLKQLQEDTASVGKELRRVKTDYIAMQKRLAILEKQNNALKSGKSAEMRALLQELNVLKDNLIEREDRVNEMEKSLSTKEQSLAALQQELRSKQQRLLELETVLQRQDSLVNALRSTVAEALFSFKGEGLTVEQKNGKVYLRLQEKLLFKSGSWNVESRGSEAIKKIAAVLENNPDIQVMVEGHTDNVPYNGSGQVKDNWDLSVKRATSIIRIIINNSKVEPSRLTAAGRSEYLPVASNKTTDGKSKNRRTEIILTPDLSELYNIIEQN